MKAQISQLLQKQLSSVSNNGTILYYLIQNYKYINANLRNKHKSIKQMIYAG